MLGQVDGWLAELFAPDGVNAWTRSPRKLDLTDPATETRAEAVRERNRSYFLHKVEFSFTFRRYALVTLADRIPSAHAAYQRVLRNRDLHVLE